MQVADLNKPSGKADMVQILSNRNDKIVTTLELIV